MIVADQAAHTPVDFEHQQISEEGRRKQGRTPTVFSNTAATVAALDRKKLFVEGIQVVRGDKRLIVRSDQDGEEAQVDLSEQIQTGRDRRT